VGLSRPEHPFFKRRDAKVSVRRRDRKQVVDRTELNKLTEKIIGIAIEVHKYLGPGFVERIYEQALVQDMKQMDINFENQKQISVFYKGLPLGFQRIDFLIEEQIVIELKAVPEINKIHLAQLLSYLKALNKKIGLILNLAKGTLDIRRVVNNF